MLNHVSAMCVILGSSGICAHKQLRCELRVKIDEMLKHYTCKKAAAAESRWSKLGVTCTVASVCTNALQLIGAKAKQLCNYLGVSSGTTYFIL